ncbi:hypothetical protein [Actinomadura oligospora]|uniref:hypothetical protein n=1 Tax=Actinomadura oligospora TaxID=111804 RepID=UPI000478DA33|nr:hypothetical protein [Actinomadura oligospora]
MINWRVATEGFDPTFPDPLGMLDLGFLGGGGLHPEAREDFGTILAGTLQDLESKLAMGPGKHMKNATGWTVDASGMGDLLADYEVDWAYDDNAVTTVLQNMSRTIAGRAAELRSGSLAYYVRTSEPGAGPLDVTLCRSTEWQNEDAGLRPGVMEAVAVELEHRSGVAIAVLMPYEYRTGRLFLGGPVAVPSRRRYWG